ncbi:hypothetical protein [Mycobacterium sp. shizuoka-1]|uniref:hypothetical protein n=1 Tax=Mycobacterium sp. shizuoka-1 TaxID=2039281 RepID=UPI000C06004A|nr:hypothetical protein [Mycobacterium sp. shizuoka-1]GAY16837.1 hypothetical protein MSZK_35630 [Mycobacterium sp. shizuoka-1]
MTDIKPSRTRIRMYQVGFGDCFLLTFEYPRALADGRRERHMLVDFGTTRLPRGLPRLGDTASVILEHTNNELDVLVVTHRHKDHLQGFGDAVSGPLTERLKPKLVMRPWTEDPKAAAGAEAPGRGVDARRRLVAGIRTGQELAAAIDQMAREDGQRDLRTAAGRLAAEAEDQVANAEAIARLDALAKKSHRGGIYASFGTKVPFEDFIPGVRCDVLGPPTIEESDRAVLRQRENDPSEFWLDTIESAAASGVAKITADEEKQWDLLTEPGGLGSARWLLENLTGQQQQSLLRLVRLVDNALNNTSLILLLTVGGSRRLLFPGDAQIENWSFALKKAQEKDRALKEMLAEVDLYKVGHHGSRNATPKTLFGFWNEPATRSRRMTALMSTLPGVHGKSDETAVPRETLVTALDRRMTLHRTDALDGEPFIEVVGPTSGRGGFELVHP